MGNELKALRRTDDELVVGNYIVLFGGRDVTGAESDLFWTGPRNDDGTVGQWFTKATQFDSPYTETGQLNIDWEHGTEPDGRDISQPGRDDILGYVNWKSARVDDNGVWVERVLRRRSLYVKWVETLIEQGVIGTSSEAIPDKVQYKATGEVTHWPLKRDTLTVMPFEPRMLGENVLQAVKGLSGLNPAFKALLEEQGAEPDKHGIDDKGSAGALRRRGVYVLARLSEIKARMRQQEVT